MVSRQEIRQTDGGVGMSQVQFAKPSRLIGAHAIHTRTQHPPITGSGRAGHRFGSSSRSMASAALSQHPRCDDHVTFFFRDEHGGGRECRDALVLDQAKVFGPTMPRAAKR
jgi:hypothetical protein